MRSKSPRFGVGSLLSVFWPSRPLGQQVETCAFFMSKNERNKNPQKVIDSFCSSIDLDEAKQLLKDWLEVALTSENDHFETAKARYWVFYFSQCVGELIEAAYILKSKKK